MKQKKKLAAKILKTSYQKIKFRGDALDEIRKAITRSDMRGLIAVNKITESGDNHQSRGRARKISAQKRKGRQKGRGSQKGRKNAEVTKKDRWMSKIRVQREFLKELREKQLLSTQNYRLLYLKSKGGYFRNKRHIKLYITEQHLVDSKQLVENK